MFRKPKYIIGLILIISAFSYLLFASLRESFQFAVTPSELLSKMDQFAKSQVKLTGAVVEGTIKFSGSDYSFKVTDGTKELNIHYKGVLPNTFREGAEVVATGRFIPETDIFEAAIILTKCASKYESKEIK